MIVINEAGDELKNLSEQKLIAITKKVDILSQNLIS